MKTTKYFCRFLSVLTAFCMITSTGVIGAFAEEADIVINLDTGTQTDNGDRQAVAGAHNDGLQVTVPAKKIKLKNGSNHKLGIGDTFQIEYTLSPSDSDDYITYKSMNTKVVHVDTRGFVTAVGEGTATVRLKTSNGVKVNVVFEVSGVSQGQEQVQTPENETASISLFTESIMLRSGETSKIEYMLYPVGSDDKVTFTSKNPSVASVTDDGIVKAHDEGNTIISITSESGAEAQCMVSVYTGIYHGIDVSKWQGKINWSKVKNHGVDFVMIRSSFGDCDVDEKLKANVAGCEKNDIPYGFYHYTYARTTKEAAKEADFFLKTIKKYSPEYPVVLDIEEAFYDKMSKKQVTDIICTFMEKLEDAGYYAMIYSSAKFFDDNTIVERLKDYDIWVACWGDEEKLNSVYSHHYGMWQYTDQGEIPGIPENEVDLNYAFKNYAERIRRFKLNNLD